jgi:hypothetical protein
MEAHYALRLLVVLFLPRSLRMCKSLKADIFNFSGRDLTVCRGTDFERKCISIASGAHKVLSWVKFQVTDRDGTFSYATPVPEPFERYRDKWKGAITVVLYANLRVLVVRDDQQPSSVTDATQPIGYPAPPRD